MSKRVMYFIDGENLVFGYQNMVNNSRQPRDGIAHSEDAFVWHSDIIPILRQRDILRVNYYTSAVGNDEKLFSIRESIKKLTYKYKETAVGGYSTEGHIVPRVFKKKRTSARSRLVDISIAIDMLNFASPDIIDIMYLLSGDGDFIPLIKAVMHKGVRVHCMALSDGLNPDLSISADEFDCIDHKLFKTQ